MKILTVNCGSKKTPEILKKLTLLNASSDEVLLSQIQAVNLKKYTGIIISGAPILLTETPYQKFSEQVNFLVNSGIPLLGICFGHQLLGMHFGAEISRCKEDRGLQEVEIFYHNDLFIEFEKRAEFEEDHCECINLPKDFRLLASSEICLNEAMRHQIHPYFGVQFHPETSDRNGLKLFQNFLNICETSNTN